MHCNINIPLRNVKIEQVLDLEMCNPPDGCDAKSNWWAVVNARGDKKA